MTDLSIVVPCYNEEEVLRETSKRLIRLIVRLIDRKTISEQSRIYFVDDGSDDATWEIIEHLTENEKYISGIKLSSNCGHQNALLAGLFTAEGDAIVSLDADLQDDIDLIEEMVDEYEKSIDIVYAARKSRKKDTLFKKWTAESFYKMMNIFGVKMVFNHADYRLLSRRAIEALKEFKEVNLFLRGIVPLIGYRSSIVYFDRAERFAGTSKYPFKKMLSFALEGITSFSITPLRFITMIGLIVFIFSFSMVGYVLVIKLFTDIAVPGWASTVLPVYLLGGIQILCIGVIGEYLGKIYTETKARPRYIIEKTINF